MTRLGQALRTANAMAVGKKPKLRKWPRPKWPHGPRLLYYKALLDMVERVQQVVRTDLIPALPGIINAHNATRPEAVTLAEEAGQRQDSPTTDIDELFEQLFEDADEAVPQAQIKLEAQKTAIRVTQWNGAEMQKQVQQVAQINLFMETGDLAEHLELFVDDNVRLVTSLTKGQLADLKGIVVRGARQGLHNKAIAEQLQEQFGATKKRAALIATDQVGKLNGELNQLRQQRLGVRRYRWSTSQDERVRAGHRKLDGTIQEWTKPPVVDERTGERGHPGQPIRCRCAAIPIIDDVLVDAGLMAPEDVELGHPTRGATIPPVPKPPKVIPSVPKPPKVPSVPALPPAPPVVPQIPLPPGVPQPPPANMPPPAKPKPPPKARVPKPPPTPPAVPQPPPQALTPREQFFTDASAEVARIGEPGAKAGADVPKTRNGIRSFLEDDYGMHAQPERRSLDTHLSTDDKPGNSAKTLAVQYPVTGEIEFRTDLMAKLQAALARKAAGRAVTDPGEIDAFTTLIHEDIHSMGGKRHAGATERVGRLVEETATETTARGVVRELFDAGEEAALSDNHMLALPRFKDGIWVRSARAYDGMLASMMASIQKATGWEAVQVTTALEKASYAFKASSLPRVTPDDAADIFVAGIPDLTVDQRSVIRSDLIQLGKLLD